MPRIVVRSPNRGDKGLGFREGFYGPRCAEEPASFHHNLGVARSDQGSIGLHSVADIGRRHAPTVADWSGDYKGVTATTLSARRRTYRSL